MQVNIKDIDRLPTSTWSWLGVNGETLETEIPDVTPFSAFSLPEHLPEGVKVSEVLKSDIVFLEGDIDTGAGPQVRDFVKANHNAGVFVEVKPGVQVAEPLVFDYTLDATNPVLADENTVIAEPGSSVTVVLRYTSAADLNGFHAGLTRLYAKKDAKITLVQVQVLGKNCPHFSDVGGTAFEDGRIELTQAELGGSRAYAAAKFKLTGDRSHTDIGSIYLGDGARNIDINYVAEHYGEKSVSEILSRGAMLDKSQKIFRGTIDFKRGAAGSKGHEEEYAVLLSPKVRARSAPLILCDEEDVDGQHAASTGRIDENRLFYLMSRGLSEADARRLIVEAQFAPILDRIPVASIRNDLQNHIIGRLNEHVGE
ncbi:Fe-S cluster assembly protein SufD [Ethanoligenens harbinense]|uniref:FeS assembly protein SufD n=1 Tax=Ethanoligenens harbinense (strain DSM 18485 / JCM 12961 / CGMCC 1.5033 / YUAN-3) TaxID=663278 RepID=E6U749_ETHHY|nr:Fe-S cluster assembly protein SufD [Ethanoligenens harbinense]ADU28119.1 FeS assembly protein SufD [Ethanoligenens harbinense YUAN-3]AVQ97127.1 Fe-S cluster assembly protein SufD [Ethanoligenens harbinense YUAN-3]AYF39789.1 Fe-S cluster assembly protein SufD [Ethanoligenens harbinense]AYF42621.1 Fe-S cluster assembly protein SufD [Ethanoligenens harbinense]QCN93370.1 Fe-S cluster assembly protein SufD [Ethanoligenens harbinense]